MITGMSHSQDSSTIATLFLLRTTLVPPCTQVPAAVAPQTPAEFHPHEGLWLDELGGPCVSDWPAPLIFPEPFPLLPLVEVADPTVVW